MGIEKVKTKYGTVIGKHGKLPGNSVFLGVPFGRPPVGRLRFAAPEEPDPWTGERVCDHFGPKPVQTPMHGKLEETGNEDCLYLNIYTPAKSAGERLPVAFWIFGGGFTGGSGSEADMYGEHLCAQGLVVVTINYRVGVLGFCALPELEQRNGRSVNAGLLDQLLALRWVQENISAFGGDPRRVMIFGQSAGGMSVRMHLTNPRAAGLFSRAVVQSGGGLNEADPIRTKEEFMLLCSRSLRQLGWSFEQLMEADPVLLSAEMQRAARESSPVPEVGFFQPFLDGLTLTEVPAVKIARGEVLDVPLCVGSVAGDSWMFTRKVAQQLQGDAKLFRGFALSPSQAWALFNAREGRRKLYTYFMDRMQPPEEGRGGWMKPPYGAGTPHASDVPYVFGTLSELGRDYSQFDYDLSQNMMRYWANFAAFGDPNGDDLPEWPAYDLERRLSMHFGDGVCRAENLVLSPEEQAAVDLTIARPGMLEHLEPGDLIPKQT